MNIFYLDSDPREAARMQCDQHVIKMILETAQLLSTAHAELDGESPAYKPTHKNHPSAVWVRKQRGHYEWAYLHMLALGDEYKRRFGKVHRTIREHAESLRCFPRNMTRDTARIAFETPPQCMPDNCKRDDTTLAYQLYYNVKADEWAERGRPMRWYRRTVE